MILYIVEFFLLHTLFYMVYKTLLSRETQLQYLRFFLLGSTLLSLTIPLIEIPSSTPIVSLNFGEILINSSQMLPAVSGEITIPWYGWIFFAVSLCFLFYVIVGIAKVLKWYRRSELDQTYELPVRKVEGMKNSFTFFKWIFIDFSHFENPEEIIRHEWGHSKKFHSLDILCFNVIRIFFWWVPSVWLMLNELKKVHEFEADQFALQTLNKSTYIKTLVHSTLRAHGLNLASSFDDAPIVNRLNFIKKMKKKISPWKLGSIMAIVLISGAMFACEEELNDEIQKITEESSQQTLYNDDVKAALEEAQRKNPDVEFTVIETLIENEESIKKLKSYHADQIEAMFVYKGDEEDHKRIVMIVSEESSLFKKTVELEELNHDDGDVFTIVEEQATFPGGKTALYEYLQSNMKYPEQAQKIGVEGRVYVEFIVEKDGSISNATVAKGIGAGCDGEALRVIKSMPKWNAGTQRGEAVRSKIVLPLSFQFSKED